MSSQQTLSLEVELTRTSITHPLRIDSLALANGRVGLTLCPGKQASSAFGPAWERDLALDFEAIAAWGASLIVTLIEDHEFDTLAVRGLQRASRAHGIDWRHFPIRDVDVPSPDSMKSWRRLSRNIHDRLESGEKVLVHCRGGLGRAGTIAALLMVERGISAERAIREIRSARPGAIETQAQEQWLGSQTAGISTNDKILHACLLGGALGDSLGAAIEFQSLETIRQRYPEGINELPPYGGQPGAITDDTQMTLFTAEGMIRARIRGELRGICHPASVVHHALLRWYRTQNGNPLAATDEIGLIEDTRFWSKRAPGMTCLSALGASGRFGDTARNDSKGCGTIMRVAPIALIAPRHRVREWAIEMSALTHGHVTGQFAAAAWAEMMADVAGGQQLEDAAQRTAFEYSRLVGGNETAYAIRAALTARRDGLPETVESLGGGWTAEEALAIALYSCLRGSSVDDCLRIAVTHGGDSDSTGAVAGNMLGIMDTEAMLSHPWATVIQCADIIRQIARDHARLAVDPSAAKELFEFYPGG